MFGIHRLSALVVAGALLSAAPLAAQRPVDPLLNRGHRMERRGEWMQHRGERFERRGMWLRRHGHPFYGRRMQRFGHRFERRGERLEHRGFRRDMRGDRFQMQRRWRRGHGWT